MAKAPKILAALKEYKAELEKIIDTDDEFESLHENIINTYKAAKRKKGEYNELEEYPPAAPKLWFETDDNSKGGRQDQLKQFKKKLLDLVTKLVNEYSTLVNLQ